MKLFRSWLTGLLCIALLCVCAGCGESNETSEPTRTVVATNLKSGDFVYAQYSDGTADITGYTGSDSDLVIPDTVGEDELPVTGIGAQAFYGNLKLKSLVIPDSVKVIGDGAFVYCGHMASLTLPAELTTIGAQAFYSCATLTELTLPDTVSIIGDYAFYKCSGLTTLTLSASLDSVGSSVFRDCTALETVTLPDGVPGGRRHDLYRAGRRTHHRQTGI